MSKQINDLYEDLVRSKKKTKKLSFEMFGGIIISSFLIIFLTNIYHFLIDSYLSNSIAPIYEEIVLLEYFWMAAFLLIFFFINLTIWFIISYLLIKRSLIQLAIIRNKQDNNFFCNICQKRITDKMIKIKINEKFKPIKLFNANGYYCKHCYKKIYLISIFTFLLIPAIYIIVYQIIRIYIFDINIRNQSKKYYMVPLSFYYLEWLSLPFFYLTMVFLILYLIIGLFRYIEIYRKSSLQNSNLRLRKKIMKLVKFDDKIKIKIAFMVALIIGALIFPLIYNGLYNQKNYYYIIEYDINAPYEDELIDNVELFDYPSYLLDYIDGDIVKEYKNYIEKDSKYDWDVGNFRHLIYYFKAEIYNNINLTYKYIYLEITDGIGKTICSSSNYHRYYMNFNILPYASQNIKIIELSEIIFVKMYLYYEHGSKFPSYGVKSGRELEIEQYVLLNMNLEILLVFIDKISELIIN
ncbi:MAG: hypothetical protein ACFFAH_17690 [Promethearchaeota archaeon]